MAIFPGDQLTNAAAVPLVKNNPTDFGRPWRQYFSLTVPAATITTSDTFTLCTIPKGARILEGTMISTAAGGSATIALGDGTTAAKYLAATSVVAAAKTLFNQTVALKFGEVQTAAITLTGTVAGSALPAAMTIVGYVDMLLAS